MNKKYSFPTEEKATELIKSLLSDEEKETNIRKVSVTKYTNGLHYMGKTDVTEYNEETKETTILKKGTTYDVDVVWRDTLTAKQWKESPLKEWADEDSRFEVDPKTPNHNWA
jgi:hypothetical protein